MLNLIERSIANRGRRVAVRAADGTLTYAELSARADRLAGALVAGGVRPGDLVAQCLDRSSALVVAALAAFRAGAAYLPLDPRYPDERLGWMLADSRAAALVTDAATAPRLAGAPTGLHLVVGDGGTLARDRDDPRPSLPAPPSPSELAYVVYTSGSTGHPKGVMVDHAALENLVEWHLDAFSLGEDDLSTQIASPGFDAAVWEIWPALAAGATIDVVPDALRSDPAGLRDWLVSEGVTVSFVPTAVAERLIALDWPADVRLRHLLTGGDALTRRPRSDLPFTVVNNYGLTETAVVATSGIVSAHGEDAPSIGRPIRGLVAHVVDADLEPVESGRAGELLLGGVALARGYLGRPELTAERFVQNGHGRLYRTGDRVREREGGELEFLGRLDDQLSVRGFRVEPGEISRTLQSHPGIATALVVGSGESGAERQLVAYVVAARAELPDETELSAFLARLLPDYMVPSRYVWLESMPLTAHGKIDRDALPRPVAGMPQVHAPRALRTSTEAAVAEILAELLDVDAVGSDENFFLLGGHSLLGAQLIARLEERFGVEIGLRYLFDHPTPAQVAAEVDRRMAEEPAGEKVAG